MKQQSDKGRLQLDTTKLKILRKEHGLSQDKLADVCQAERLRVSLSSIKRAECGQKVLYRTATELAKFYRVPIEQLIDGPLASDNCSSPLSTTHIPHFVTLVVLEFRHEKSITQALKCVPYITSHHDHQEQYLRLWLDEGNPETNTHNPIVPLCLVFKRIFNKDTRLLIQSYQGTFNQGWEETRQALENIVWGQVVVKNDVASTIL